MKRSGAKQAAHVVHWYRLPPVQRCATGVARVQWARERERGGRQTLRRNAKEVEHLRPGKTATRESRSAFLSHKPTTTTTTTTATTTTAAIPPNGPSNSEKRRAIVTSNPRHYAAAAAATAVTVHSVVSAHTDSAAHRGVPCTRCHTRRALQLTPAGSYRASSARESPAGERRVRHRCGHRPCASR